MPNSNEKKFVNRQWFEANKAWIKFRNLSCWELCYASCHHPSILSLQIWQNSSCWVLIDDDWRPTSRWDDDFMFSIIQGSNLLGVNKNFKFTSHLTGEKLKNFYDDDDENKRIFLKFAMEWIKCINKLSSTSTLLQEKKLWIQFHYQSIKSLDDLFYSIQKLSRIIMNFWTAKITWK